MHVTVRVKPGASRVKVGGAYGDALVVAVSAPPVDGRANAAVCEAVAKAFGLRRSRVTLVSGATGRTKVLDVDAPDAEVSARLAALLNITTDAGQI